MALKEEIQSLIQGEVSDEAAELERCSRDASIFQVSPELIVYPKTAEDLARLVRYVSESKQPLSLTPRSAGTDMSGGPLTESIVVDMTRHFNRIGKITDHYAVTQPGTYYRDFEKQTLKHQRLMPSYTASRELCTVGGMVANDSAGEKTLSYGKVHNYVGQLKVVLADGQEYTIEPLTKHELEQKLRLKTFEGRFYRQLYHLLTTHQELIQKAKPVVSKNSAGYALWNIWDGKTFDLTQLFTGSQGTLGIITEITFKLIQPKKAAQLLIIPLTDLKPLATVVNRILTFKPESFECYDDNTLRLAVRFLPHIARRLKLKNWWQLIKEFLPEFGMLLQGRVPKLVLIAEFTADSLAVAKHQAHQAQASLSDLGLESEIALKKLEARKHWVIRRESFSLLRQHSKEKYTAPFIDDIAVLPEKLPEFLPELDRVMSQYKLVYTLAGHIGDGNFHIMPLMDMKDPATRTIIPQLSKAVFDLVFRYQGSMSGEHNDGLVRTPYLKDMYGPAVCKLFAEVKQIFDPQNIFNPGKKVQVTMKYAMDHLVTEN